LYQIEYATKAVENSGTIIGICCKDGVVLGVEKLIESKMMERDTNQRIYTIDRHIGMAVAGWKPDSRQIVNKARSECKNYKSFYGSRIPGHLCCDRLSSYIHMYTLYWHLRPFGVSMLLASYDDEKGPGLFMIEPSGSSWGYYACAIGKAKQAAKTELDKLDLKNMTCKEAVNHVARIIYKVHDPIKDKDFELELSWVCDESKKEHVKVPKDIKDEAIRLAQEALKAEEESDDEELGDAE
jgi:20S proteasome subunit alpha 7